MALQKSLMDPQPHLESSDAVMEMAMAASALTEAERVQKTQQMEAQEAAEMERAIEASCTPVSSPPVGGQPAGAEDHTDKRPKTTKRKAIKVATGGQSNNSKVAKRQPSGASTFSAT